MFLVLEVTAVIRPIDAVSNKNVISNIVGRAMPDSCPAMDLFRFPGLIITALLVKESVLES